MKILDKLLGRPEEKTEIDLGMNLYQKLAKDYALYPEGAGKVYTALGLTSEAGEYAGKIKKLIRGDEVKIEAAIDELGDVLWYVAMAANELQVPLHVVAGRNIRKLNDRKQRDVIKGDGDGR